MQGDESKQEKVVIQLCTWCMNPAVWCFEHKKKTKTGLIGYNIFTYGCNDHLKQTEDWAKAFKGTIMHVNDKP